jgi:glycerol-3-phosphate acyltransferase PlsX
VIRVALDAMGSDQAPRTEVEGVALALRELPPTFSVQLVGQTGAIDAELARHPDLDRARVEVVEAPEVIGMAEKPLQAVRKKRKSSLVIGLGLQAQGKSDAFISAGNTGAMLAASTCCWACMTVSSAPPSGPCFPPWMARSLRSTPAPTWSARRASWWALPISARCTCAPSSAGRPRRSVC